MFVHTKPFNGPEEIAVKQLGALIGGEATRFYLYVPGLEGVAVPMSGDGSRGSRTVNSNVSRAMVT